MIATLEVQPRLQLAQPGLRVEPGQCGVQKALRKLKRALLAQVLNAQRPLGYVC